MSIPQLWLARHAAPLIAPGHCYGRLDIPADAAATQAAAQALAQALPQRVLVWHSPLQRCAQLAHALQALRPELGSQPDVRLQEMDFGAWEGSRWDDISRHDIDAWVADFAHYRPGGGESLQAMLLRVDSAWQEAQSIATERQSHVLWISHAGVARCLDWLQQAPATQPPNAAQWPQQAPALGAWRCWPLDVVA